MHRRLPDVKELMSDSIHLVIVIFMLAITLFLTMAVMKLLNFALERFLHFHVPNILEIGVYVVECVLYALTVAVCAAFHFTDFGNLIRRALRTEQVDQESKDSPLDDENVTDVIAVVKVRDSGVTVDLEDAHG